MKYLSPRSDVGFKKLFGNVNHKDLTISFLNSILGLTGTKAIESIKFRDTEQLPETDEGRKSFFDVYCIDNAGKHFIIEMQSRYQSHFIVRSQYYTSLAFYRQIHTPFSYEKLVPVIFIGVLDHILDDRHNQVISCHKLMDVHHKTESSQHQIYYFIELPKFEKTIEQCSSDIDTWLFFMTQADKIEKIPGQLQESKNFKEAFYLLERSRWTERELDDYLFQADQETQQERYLKGAQEKAERKGEIRGEIKGQIKGEHKKAQSVAIKLLKKGISISEIVDITELSIEQIEELQKKIV